jgi:hypothetical protein
METGKIQSPWIKDQGITMVVAPHIASHNWLLVGADADSHKPAWASPWDLDFSPALKS